jgi:hypothetical protein
MVVTMVLAREVGGEWRLFFRGYNVSLYWSNK